MISNTKLAGHEVRELPFPANLFVLSIVVGLATTVAVIFASEKTAKTVVVKRTTPTAASVREVDASSSDLLKSRRPAQDVASAQ
jgi:hypothetical protein